MLAGIEFRAFQMEVIEDRRSRGPDRDLVSTLCHAEVDGAGLDDESIVQESLLILIGGDETSRHVLTGGMLALMAHPEQRDRLAADPQGRIDGAVEEMLRWVTPIKNMSRTVMEDVELGGQQLRAGQDVMLFYPSGDRDEAHFVEPFAFDIERDPNHHMAFGFGTHFCLGASLARLELNRMFRRLMERLPDIELVDDTPLPYRASNFISGPEAMPVRFTPTAPVGP